ETDFDWMRPYQTGPDRSRTAKTGSNRTRPPQTA
ncbi:hypothetical protein CP02DC14_2156, partial [Chlamydia psittaci 02DC14]